MFNKILDEEDVQQKARIDFNPICAGLKLVGGIITKTSKSLLIPRLESSLLHRLFLVFSKSFFKGFFRRLVLSLSLLSTPLGGGGVRSSVPTTIIASVKVG